MNLVVVGDCLLDVDVVGSASRVCPDAPALVVDEEARQPRPGGAGLAAWLAGCAGESVTLVTALAADEEAELLRARLGRITTVSGPSDAPTPVKTRVRVDGHTVARIDRTGAGRPTVTDEMVTAVEAADAILVSDYGRGLTADPRLRHALTRMVDEVPVVWDPHPHGAAPVPGVTLATPNLGEATRFCGTSTGPSDDTAEHLAARLRRRWRAAAVAVTLGGRGALLDDGAAPRLIPAPAVSVVDPCGAGDRFAVAVTSRLMRHDGVPAAVGHAVGTAADFVAAGGAAVITGGAIASRGEADESGLAGALRLAESVRARGGTVAATGGCFDLLHAGHIRTLTAARRLGDCLIVCLNSDESVRRLKGATRPLNAEADRVEVLRALGCVDHVVVFTESGPERVLAELRPQVWVKGGDYTPESLPETELVRGWGGAVVVVPYHDGRSTTRLARMLTEAG
ncbi:MAG TPA: D-glycero-beta-D-manno-heptose 1-phosphate adenylyltransferase [Actinophytocola sp.]|nr:D-glycero-beta-D-manno-heptose 1-phosphate adenylyltransferase [Actinophytocola sp.]